MRITRTGDSSDNHIKSSLFLDNLDDFVIEERAIGANPSFSDRFWQFGEGTLQQRDGDRRDVGVAGMVAALPTILCVPLEAHQRKVRGAPALLGVVAPPRLVPDDHRPSAPCCRGRRARWAAEALLGQRELPDCGKLEHGQISLGARTPMRAETE